MTNTNNTKVTCEDRLAGIKMTRKQNQKELDRFVRLNIVEKNKRDRSNHMILGCVALAAIALGIYGVTSGASRRCVWVLF